MEDRDGQHMGVVTKALVKVVPPSSMILRVLFITCREPVAQDVELLFLIKTFSARAKNIHLISFSEPLISAKK